MAKKVISKTKKSLAHSKKLHQIEACIYADYAKLEKEYPKAIAATDKEIDRLAKAIKKVKAATKLSQKARSKKVNMTALEKELDSVATEAEALTAGFKKLKAKKKVWQEFERSWAKKLKQQIKSKKSVKKSVSKPKKPKPSKIASSEHETFSVKNSEEM